MTSRNQVTAVVLVLGLIGVLDCVTRVYVPRSAAGRDMQFEVAAPRERPLSLAEARQRLQSWLPAEAPPQDLPVVANNASDAAAVSLPDRGDLAGWRFILRGVFDAGTEFAVLDIMSTSGGETEQHRLLAGDEIKGVSVERISGHSVYLSDGETIMRLALFVEPEVNATPAEDQVMNKSL